MYQLVNEAPFMSTTEMETVVSLCYRALDGSNYDARYAVAELLGNLCATTLNPKPNMTNGKYIFSRLFFCENFFISDVYFHWERISEGKTSLFI